MLGMHRYQYSESDGREIMNFARDTIEIYTKEGQKMDVGSVSDLLNMRAGAFLQIKSTGAFSRVRGSGAVYNSQRLASSIINSTIYAASDRSVGSEISRNELSEIVFKIAPIEEVRVTDDPKEELNIGYDVPIIMSGEEHSWLYPTDAKEYEWSPEEYLRRTCGKIGLEPDYWENNKTIIAKTRPIWEEEPVGSIQIDE